MIIDNYNKEGLVQAFVKFLEMESQPRNESPNAPTLLNIVHPSTSLGVTTTANTTITSINSPNSTLSSNVPAEQQQQQQQFAAAAAVQPVLLTDGMLQTFAPPRNSSSILKDILSDS